ELGGVGHGQVQVQLLGDGALRPGRRRKGGHLLEGQLDAAAVRPQDPPPPPAPPPGGPAPGAVAPRPLAVPPAPAAAGRTRPGPGCRSRRARPDAVPGPLALARRSPHRLPSPSRFADAIL